MSYKRSGYALASRTSKRRRKMRTSYRRIPRSLLPEMKQFLSLTSFSVLNADCATQKVAGSIAQGDGGNQFIGSKIRGYRLRILYDYSNLTLTDAVRLSVVIPKDPGATAFVNDVVEPWESNDFTVLYDTVLANDPSQLSGIVDITGPWNIEYSVNPAIVRRNDIAVVVFSAGAATNLASSSNIRYTLWYTDA